MKKLLYAACAVILGYCACIDQANAAFNINTVPKNLNWPTTSESSTNICDKNSPEFEYVKGILQYLSNINNWGTGSTSLAEHTYNRHGRIELQHIIYTGITQIIPGPITTVAPQYANANALCTALADICKKVKDKLGDGRRINVSRKKAKNAQTDGSLSFKISLLKGIENVPYIMTNNQASHAAKNLQIIIPDKDTKNGLPATVFLAD